MTRRLTAPAPPPGFVQVADFVDADEERRLVSELEAIAFEPVVMRGAVGRREVAHFGVRYAFDARALTPAPDPPAQIAALVPRAAALGGLDPSQIGEILAARYPAGATIGWHRDAPTFGSVVVGVSLAGPCRLRFRRRLASGDFEAFAIALPPRSAYVIAGAARAAWQHSIPPVPSLRYSLTFRTIRTGHRRADDGPADPR